MKARIIKELVPNPTIRVYHTTARLSKAHIQTFDKPLAEHNDQELEEVGKIGSELVAELLDLDGVVRVTLRAYELSVEIGEAFDWEDVENGIIISLRRIFSTQHNIPGDDVHVTQKYRAEKWQGGFTRDPGLLNEPKDEDFGL